MFFFKKIPCVPLLLLCSICLLFSSDQNLGQVPGAENTNYMECQWCIQLSHLNDFTPGPGFAVHPALALHLALARPLLLFLLPSLALHLALTLCLIS
jgi:hypothetical protein